MMSADRWSKCPFCEKKSLARIEARKKQIEKDYGKLTFAEFKQAEAKLQALESAVDATLVKQTLREDYYVGLATDDDGRVTFDIQYMASCSECGWAFEHKAEHDVPKLKKNGAFDAST